jgi:hypothetical protein
VAAQQHAHQRCDRGELHHRRALGR